MEALPPTIGESHFPRVFWVYLLGAILVAAGFADYPPDRIPLQPRRNSAGRLDRDLLRGRHGQITNALVESRVKVFFVTHRFGFAEHYHRQQADSTLVLRAERQPDGRRDYKLAVKEPLPTSFGEDLYYRLGGWLEEDKAVAPQQPRTLPAEAN